MINIIVAISDNNAIGRGGDMPWHISADLKYFKKKTIGSAVIMGRRTWESLGCKPLGNRLNIVVSGTLGQTRGMVVVPSLPDALALTDAFEDVFIMGGGQLYRSALPLAGRLLVTHVHTTVPDADTFFPEIDMDVWQRVSVSETQTDPATGYEFESAVYEPR